MKAGPPLADSVNLVQCVVALQQIRIRSRMYRVAASPARRGRLQRPSPPADGDAPRARRQRAVPASATMADTSPLRDTQLASMAAGLLTRICLHPLDTVKTRLQHMRGTPPARAILDFVLREHFRGLYRGAGVALLGVLPFSALYMPSYELASRFVGSGALAGAFAGFASSVVKTPVDVVKKRTQAGLYANVWLAILGVNAEAVASGPLARFRPYYAGWRSSVVYDSSYSATQFMVLEVVRGAMRRRLARKAGFGAGEPAPLLSTKDSMFAGAVTGAATSLLTEPMDVVKTRMLTQRRLGLQEGVTFYRNWAHCLKTIAMEESPRALWKGSIPRLVTVSVSSALWLGFYTFVKQQLRNRDEAWPGRRRDQQRQEGEGSKSY